MKFFSKEADRFIDKADILLFFSILFIFSLGAILSIFFRSNYLSFDIIVLISCALSFYGYKKNNSFIFALLLPGFLRVLLAFILKNNIFPYSIEILLSFLPLYSILKLKWNSLNIKKVSITLLSLIIVSALILKVLSRNEISFDEKIWKESRLCKPSAIADKRFQMIDDLTSQFLTNDKTQMQFKLGQSETHSEISHESNDLIYCLGRAYLLNKGWLIISYDENGKYLTHKIVVRY